MPPRTLPERLAVPATQMPANMPAHARWHTVDAAGHTLGFVLRRSRRQSIGFVVDDNGLRVTAPSWATLAQINDAIRARSGWIISKLMLRRERLDNLARAQSLWSQEGRLPYLGVSIRVTIADVRAPCFSGCLDAPETKDTLCLPTPVESAHQRQVRTEAWLRERAREHFGQRLTYFVGKSGRLLQGWRLSSAKTRWGSCSHEGRIMLNWRLIHFRKGIIDYVIAHEVAHLREMNHSAAFWRELQRLLPGFEAARAELRQYRPAALPLIPQ